MKVAHPALVDKSKICLPPLNIKFRLIKIFVKSMDKESEVFGYLRKKTSQNKCDQDKKKYIFVGPEIKQKSEDQDLSIKLNSAERIAWITIENVCRNFIGNEKREIYSEIFQQIISSYSAVGW
jgi:hypothetical protein